MVEPKTIAHTGRYWYMVDNLHPVAGPDAVVRLWMALPVTRAGQTVSNLACRPEPATVYEDPVGGNRIAYWEVRDFTPEGRLTITVDFDVEAKEVLTAVDAAAVQEPDTHSDEYRRYTVSEAWIERTPELETAAREVVGSERNPYLAAKRIFDFVLDEMSYEFPEPSQRGAGQSFARRKGDCGEFSVVFTALCRAVGIPARTVTCVWFTGLGHQWAEFLCPPYGWIPVDASVAEAVRSDGEAVSGAQDMRTFCKNRSIPWGEPDWLFGNLYANRLMVFIGTNVEAGERTFACMQPAGVMATPDSFESEHCGDQVVHGGFFLFDEGCRDPQRARETAKQQLAQAYFDAGLHAPAEEGFLQTVAETPKHSLAWLHLGQIRMARGELQEARDAFSECVRGEFGSVQPVLGTIGLLLRGHCFDLEGLRADAVADYEAVLASGVDYQGVPEAARRGLETPFDGEDESDG